MARRSTSARTGTHRRSEQCGRLPATERRSRGRRGGVQRSTALALITAPCGPSSAGGYAVNWCRRQPGAVPRPPPTTTRPAPAGRPPATNSPPTVTDHGRRPSAPGPGPMTLATLRALTAIHCGGACLVTPRRLWPPTPRRERIRCQRTCERPRCSTASRLAAMSSPLVRNCRAAAASNHKPPPIWASSMW